MVLWVCVVRACAERNQNGDLSQGRWVLHEWALKAEEIRVQSRHKEDAYRHQSAEVNQGADLSQGISDIIEYFQLAEGCMVMYSVAVFVHVHTVFGLPWLCLLSGDLQCGYFCPWTHRLSSAFTLPAVWWFTMWLFLSMYTPSLPCLDSACCLVIYSVAVFVHGHTVVALRWLCCLLCDGLQCGCFCPWTHRLCPALTLPAMWWFAVWQRLHRQWHRGDEWKGRGHDSQQVQDGLQEDAGQTGQGELGPFLNKISCSSLLNPVLTVWSVWALTFCGWFTNSLHTVYARQRNAQI